MTTSESPVLYVLFACHSYTESCHSPPPKFDWESIAYVSLDITLSTTQIPNTWQPCQTTPCSCGVLSQDSNSNPLPTQIHSQPLSSLLSYIYLPIQNTYCPVDPVLLAALDGLGGGIGMMLPVSPRCIGTPPMRLIGNGRVPVRVP